MARPLRIEFPGAVYHVTARGNERTPIYRGDRDRRRFLTILADVIEQFHLLLHAYVLMDNHYHLLVETLEANLGRAMREINGTYAQLFNRSHRRTGHLLQGRYKAPLVERDSYLVELSRYIHLNPVRAGMVVEAEDYAWSSARAYVGKCSGPRFLTVAEVLGHFAAQPRRARQHYAAFLRETTAKPSSSPLDNVVAQTLLGAPGWVEAMRERIGVCASAGRIAGADGYELPALRRLRPRPTLAQVIAVVAATTAITTEVIGRPGARRTARAVAIYLARKAGGLALTEIGAAFGIQPSGASKAINRIERALKHNRPLRRLIAELNTALQVSGTTASVTGNGGRQQLHGDPSPSAEGRTPPGR